MDHRQLWAGRVVSGLVVLFLLADAATALLTPAKLAPEMAATGFPAAMIAPVGLVTLLAAILYAIPRTATLGAILIAGFCGGAIATHLRLGEIGSPPQLICTALGLLTWLGLWLRDERVRALLPLQSNKAS